ncbi:MAG: thioredoxin family protein [Desulfatibacillaceae bacterium]
MIHESKGTNIAPAAIITVCLALLFTPGPASASDPARDDKTAGDISWMSHEAAKDMLKKTDKSLYIFFFTNWCGYCTKMDRETLANKDVIDYINENYLPVRVNAEKEKKVASAYRVRGFPTNIFAQGEGKPGSSLPGYVGPGDFLNILKYIHTGAYEDMSIDVFIEREEKKTARAE